MPFIAKKSPWHESKIQATDEKAFYNRRSIIKNLGLVSGLALCSPFISPGCSNKPRNNNENKEIDKSSDLNFSFSGMDEFYPPERNTRYGVGLPLTREYDATHRNNFYEFISREDPDIYNVYKFVSEFDTSDWKIEIGGLVDKPGTYALEDLIRRFGIEERVYRFRCVERWAMVVPWSGFPLSKLIKLVSPTNKANFVRMISYSNPDQMEGVRNLTHYPWPYFEGLRIDEAMNELAFLATGLYGKPIPKQNGAPVRLVVPWKYGYKNIKSIIKMEFVENEPETFWHTIAPNEYPFISNVDPTVPHPRWSQAYEQLIPDGEKRPTLPYNGYGEFVASLYS